MYYNKREGIDHEQVVFARVLPSVTREENYRAQFFSMVLYVASRPTH